MATLIFRVISLLLLGYGLCAFVLTAKFAAGIGVPFLYARGVPPFVLAIVLFVVAPPARATRCGLAPPTAAAPNER